MVRVLSLLAAVLFLSCGGGDPRLGGACKVTCDCPNLTAPIKCPGEWSCNANSRCEYTCHKTCDSSGVSTCPVDEDCNGSLCSLRKACK